VALDASGLVAGGGRYVIDAPQLTRFRDAIAADRSGGELAATVDRLREKAYELGGQELKRVPRPHPQHHPRRDLLRHKRLMYWRRWAIGPWIATPEALDRVAHVWRDGAELNAWLTRHLEGG
jgi:hypothetical protein